MGAKNETLCNERTHMPIPSTQAETPTWLEWHQDGGIPSYLHYVIGLLSCISCFYNVYTSVLCPNALDITSAERIPSYCWWYQTCRENTILIHLLPPLYVESVPLNPLDSILAQMMPHYALYTKLAESIPPNALDIPLAITVLPNALDTLERCRKNSS